ncbi:MAG: hypothetical protein ACXVEF_22585 [Polyangiales bacterium]
MKLRDTFAIATVCVLSACAGSRAPETIPSVPVASLPGHDKLAVDTAPKDDLRLVPAEAYVRTYLALFGGLAPLEVQKKARGADGAQLFDAWSDYLATLGFPDDMRDLPRAQQTNALMVSAFERLGAALCDRAVEHDLKAKSGDRLVFDFDGEEAKDEAAFAPKFDVVHRTFLGYPASLAPKERLARFHGLFQRTVERHQKEKGPKGKLTPEEAGWVAVCEGLVRHPEFHLY